MYKNQTALSNIDIFCQNFFLTPAIKISDRAIYATPLIGNAIDNAKLLVANLKLNVSIERSPIYDGIFVVRQLMTIKNGEVLINKGALEISVKQNGIVFTEATGLSITILPGVINEIVTAYNSLK